MESPHSFHRSRNANNNNIEAIRWFQRQHPTSGGTVRSPDLQIVVISSLQTVSTTVFRFRVSLQRLMVPMTPACTWWNRPEEDPSSGKLESTHPSRTSVKYDQVFFGVESIMRVNAASLDIRDATTSTPGTLNDLTTDLIMANNNNMPHRPSDSSRPRQRLLLSGDVHQNPGPATKYPCSVCTSNVTSRGVSYMCNRCSGWVHSKCSGLQNAAE